MSKYTIRHLLEDGTSEDIKVDVHKWEMEEVQSVYPTKVRFDDIPMVRLDNVITMPPECIGVYDILDSWDFDGLQGWIYKQAKEQSIPIHIKTYMSVIPEKVISGVVPDQDWWVVYDEWSDHYLGQLEIVEDDGKVHRGVFGYKADDYLKPSASVIEEKLKPLAEWKQRNYVEERLSGVSV